VFHKTPVVNFINFLRAHFFVQKRIFGARILYKSASSSFVIFGAKILAKKAREKC